MARPVARDRTVAWLVVATAACYGIGYPVALVAHSFVGWILVFLGGPLLIALGVVVVRRVHRSAEERGPSPVQGDPSGE